jgi:hypothetical protein
MTVKQLIKKLKHPHCERIAAVRIEFEDGGIYEVSPDAGSPRAITIQARVVPTKNLPGRLTEEDIVNRAALYSHELDWTEDRTSIYGDN